ncbi:hypothetical protein ACG2F4_10560 [Halalkalibaculum sp. DA3122]|uniref:hypothetical protein n=1 Tax=Halalkalibaculum sp. DA3122 TaxID=3373607 RepID=UPI003754FD83
MLDTLVDNYLRRLLSIGAAGVVLLAFFFWALPAPSALALVAGYLLSFTFVASNFLLVRKINLDDQKKFLTLFFGSITLRFMLVLVCFALVLAYLKIDQILFTISFIISYILHSVIEIIFINKILENRHEN